MFVGSTLLVIAVLLFFNRGQIADDFFREFPPSAFGFSSQEQMQFQCSRACTKVVSRSLVHSVLNMFSDRSLDSLEVNIGFSDMQILLEDQRAAIASNTLSDPREVKGNIDYRGERYPVKIRLKGELKDHWSEPGRMSLKVSVGKGRTIMGFSSFSLHKPASRQHPYEPAFEDFARATGGIAVRHEYANLTVNGEYWGIWNVEERVSTELLEKQQRKDSLIFDLGLDPFWQYVRTSAHPYTDPSYRLKDVHLFANAYSEKRIRKDIDLRRKYSYVLQQLMVDDGEEIYDWPAMARSVLLAYVWGTNHVLLGGNSRYYLNPYTLKLEPITSDQSWPKLVAKYGLTYPYPKPYRHFIESDAFRSLYLPSLQMLKEKESELNPLFWKYYSLFPNDVHQTLGMVFANLQRAEKSGYQDILYLHRNVLPTDRFVYIPDPSAAEKLTPQVRKDLQFHVHARHFTNGIVRVRNLLDIPVKLEEVRASDGIFWEGLPEMPPKGQVDLATPFDGIRDNEVQVVTSIDEFTRIHETGLSVIPLRQLRNPLLNFSDPAETYGFIERDLDGYRFLQGEWRIDRPLIIKGDLDIPAGTTLRFAPDAYLIVNGSLNASGEATLPVRMVGISDRWKGVYVFSSAQASEWNYVEVSGATELGDGPLHLSGGVNFYRADLQANHVTIRDSHAEDALNIVHSDVDLNQILVAQARSDAIDMDFATGIVRNLTIERSGGDGLDLSGSDIRVENMTTTDIKDKALSAGESSKVFLRGARMDSVGVGIASKDGSRVIAEDVGIHNVTLHPAMSYRKKDFYDYPELALVRFASPAQSSVVRQIGSGLTLDGVSVAESQLDVEALYRGDVMGK